MAPKAAEQTAVTTELVEQIRAHTVQLEQLMELEHWGDALELSNARHALIERAFADLEHYAQHPEFVAVMEQVQQSNARLGQQTEKRMRSLGDQVVDLRRTFAQTQAYQRVSDLTR